MRSPPQHLRSLLPAAQHPLGRRQGRGPFHTAGVPWHPPGFGRLGGLPPNRQTPRHQGISNGVVGPRAVLQTGAPLPHRHIILCGQSSSGWSHLLAQDHPKPMVPELLVYRSRSGEGVQSGRRKKLRPDQGVVKPLHHWTSNRKPSSRVMVSSG